MDDDNNILTIPRLSAKMIPTQIAEHPGDPAVTAVSRALPECAARSVCMNTTTVPVGPGIDQQNIPSTIRTGGEAYKFAETTRLLCAAAWLDGGFRNTVLKWYHEDNRHRATAPNFGVDMATVVRQCARARSALNSREAWLLIPVALALVALAAAPVPGLVLAYLVAFAMCLVYTSRARSVVTKHFMRGKFDPEALLSQNQQTSVSLREAEAGNCLVYSGFTPFVGSGENIGGWSFALDLRKSADGSGDLRARDLSQTVVVMNGPPGERISLADLYDRINRDIGDLHLDRVFIDDKLYINGRDIRDDKRFLDDPLACPRNCVTHEVMQQAMLEQTEQKLRHYRCIRVVDWNGEQVLSIFLRLSKLSHNLFVEASYFLLTPVGDRFRKIDSLDSRMTFRRAIETTLLAAVAAPFLTVWGPIALLQRVMEMLQVSSRRAHEEKLILDDPSFDYGAALSCRQWASPNLYRRYFQKLDKEMYFKVLEKNVLDSILTFLEENNVDVSELKQRQAMILNNGVIVSGGSMTTENLAVGEGAKVDNLKQKVTNIAARSVSAEKRAS
jgi:hypothetical protein